MSGTVKNTRMCALFGSNSKANIPFRVGLIAEFFFFSDFRASPYLVFYTVLPQKYLISSATVINSF